MEELHAQRAPTAAATQPAAAPAPSAFATPEADPWGQSELQQHAQPAAQPQPVVDLLGGSSDPFAAPAQQQQQQPQQQQPSAPVDLFGAAPVAGEKYKALTDYAPGDPRMLALKKGDLLTKEKEEDGWFFGSNDRGQSGYFPYAAPSTMRPGPAVRARSPRSLPRSSPRCTRLAPRTSCRA